VVVVVVREPDKHGNTIEEIAEKETCGVGGAGEEEKFSVYEISEMLRLNAVYVAPFLSALADLLSSEGEK
jgi:hypothetical protein